MSLPLYANQLPPQKWQRLEFSAHSDRVLTHTVHDAEDQYGKTWLITLITLNTLYRANLASKSLKENEIDACTVET